MAKLFMSYSRKDARAAQRFAQWLEGDGHDVWRDDDDISGGASFSAEIEKALNDCDAVLALWSANSVQSAWVRDEAAVGRDKGKLIPFSIDRTEPPLGFRQFQSIDISKWKGHGWPPNAERISQAIERVANVPAAARTRGRRASRSWPAIARRGWFLAGGVLAAAAIATAGLFVWQRSVGQQIAIAVLASPQSPDRAMATDYASVAAADMAALLPRHFDRATVIAPAEAANSISGYRMLVSAGARGAGANASVTLSDADGRTTLWSKNWSVDDASAADLKAEVSAAASKAALCLTEAKGGTRGLSQPALGLFLNGCIGLGDTKLSDVDFVTIFERIIRLDPDFAPAWDYLALSRSWIAEGLPDASPARAAAVRSARDSIAIARRLNPNSAMSYDAEYHLIANKRFRGLEVLSEGAKVDPDDGRIQMHLSDAFLAVGRLTDAVQAAQRGVQLEPGSPWVTSQYIQALVYSGQFSNARAAIPEARKRWPSNPAIDYAELAYEFRYGDARAALPLLPSVTGRSDAGMIPYRKLIAARLDPTPAKIDEAIAALKVGGADAAAENRVLQALGNFNRVDEAYRLLQNSEFQSVVDTAILFRPDFAGIRADPRFMQVAAHLGLADYWRQSGYWPDFCASEELKYDCKAEAAKYAGSGAAGATR